MKPGKYPMTITRGGTLKITLSARAKESGLSTDFTKYDVIRLQVRPPWVYQAGVDSPAPLLEMTLANGRISLVNANLGVELNLSAAKTAALTFNEGKYELELVDTTVTPEVVDKMLYGPVTVTGEVVV